MAQGLTDAEKAKYLDIIALRIAARDPKREVLDRLSKHKLSDADAKTLEKWMYEPVQIGANVFTLGLNEEYGTKDMLKDIKANLSEKIQDLDAIVTRANNYQSAARICFEQNKKGDGKPLVLNDVMPQYVDTYTTPASSKLALDNLEKSGFPVIPAIISTKSAEVASTKPVEKPAEKKTAETKPAEVAAARPDVAKQVKDMTINEKVAYWNKVAQTPGSALGTYLQTADQALLDADKKDNTGSRVKNYHGTAMKVAKAENLEKFAKENPSYKDAVDYFQGLYQRDKKGLNEIGINSTQELATAYAGIMEKVIVDRSIGKNNGIMGISLNKSGQVITSVAPLPVPPEPKKIAKSNEVDPSLLPPLTPQMRKDMGVEYNAKPLEKAPNKESEPKKEQAQKVEVASLDSKAAAKSAIQLATALPKETVAALDAIDKEPVEEKQQVAKLEEKNSAVKVSPASEQPDHSKAVKALSFDKKIEYWVSVGKAPETMLNRYYKGLDKEISGLQGKDDADSQLKKLHGEAIKVAKSENLEQLQKDNPELKDAVKKYTDSFNRDKDYLKLVGIEKPQDLAAANAALVEKLLVEKELGKDKGAEGIVLAKSSEAIPQITNAKLIETQAANELAAKAAADKVIADKALAEPKKETEKPEEVKKGEPVPAKAESKLTKRDAAEVDAEFEKGSKIGGDLVLLKKGSGFKPQIAFLQDKLIELGYLQETDPKAENYIPHEHKGYMNGNVTVDAVERFQKDVGLHRDGKVYNDTWLALKVAVRNGGIDEETKAEVKKYMDAKSGLKTAMEGVGNAPAVAANFSQIDAAKIEEMKKSSKPSV